MRNSMRAFLAKIAVGLVLAVAAAGAHAATPIAAARTRDAHGRWIATWVAAPQLTEPQNLPPAPGLSGRTLRQVIQPSLGGARLRVTLSNAFGDGELKAGSVHVARSAGGAAIETASDQALTFAG